MDDFQGTYAPQSPDLSGYHSYDQQQPDPFAPPPPQQQQLHYYQHPPHQYHQITPQHPPQFDPFAPDPPHHHQYQHHQYPHPQMPAMPPTTSKTSSRTQPFFQDEDFIPDHHAAPQKLSRKSKKPHPDTDDPTTCAKPAPGVAEGIDVKTKFPVARIKRIMQADEDVGKVSQVTPTAVSKALELFITSLTLKSLALAREKNSRRVTAAHLKAAVLADEQMDFLEQIVARVPDAVGAGAGGGGKGEGGGGGGTGTGGRKKGRETEEEEEVESSEEVEEEEEEEEVVAPPVVTRKRKGGRGGGRRKRGRGGERGG